MKNNVFILLILVITGSGLTAQSTPDSTGLLGDNFSLEAALDAFKNAENPEDFEKRINEESSNVNNLDLNEDGDIDYIRVIDNMDGDNHAIILRTDIDANESQDIAVIEIEKTGNETAILQIVGDEDLYGEDHFVEAFEIEEDNNGRGPSGNVAFAKVVVNVWFWPSVRYVYRPGYKVYVSPWRWAHYPRYWKPWKPHPWRFHATRVVHLRSYYRPVSTHRVVKAHKIYTPVRKSSASVRTRSVNRTVVKTKNGNTISRTKTTTGAAKRSKSGKVKAGKTTKSKTTRVNKKGNKAGVKKKKTVRKKKG